MFDASVIANVLYISDGFHTAPFAIIASHTVSRRVSDRSVVLAASCSSASGTSSATGAPASFAGSMGPAGGGGPAGCEELFPARFLPGADGSTGRGLTQSN